MQRNRTLIDACTVSVSPFRMRSAVQSGAETQLLSVTRCASGVSAARRSTERDLLDTADHIEKRLTLFARHNGSGALEGVGQGGGVVDALAMATRRDADLLECREAIEFA